MRRSGRIGLAMAAMTGALVLAAGEAFGQQTGATQEFSYLRHYFIDGGWVVWFIEFPMSIAMLALVIMFVLEMRTGSLIPPVVMEQIRGLLDARQYRQAIEFTANEPSMISFVVHASLSEAASGYPAMERAMEEAIEERSSRLLRKIEFLNIIGNVAPMVGLFGTVLGMIQTFNAIVRAQGVPNPADLAHGISVALVTTYWGLLIAIPALSAFSLLRNQVEGTGSRTALQTQELLSMFNPAAQRGAPTAGGQPAAQAAPRPQAPPAGAQPAVQPNA